MEAKIHPIYIGNHLKADQSQPSILSGSVVTCFACNMLQYLYARPQNNYGSFGTLANKLAIIY